MRLSKTRAQIEALPAAPHLLLLPHPRLCMRGLPHEPVALVSCSTATNYPRLSGLKQCQFIVLPFWRSRQGWFLLEASVGSIHSLAFLSFQRPPAFLGSWLLSLIIPTSCFHRHIFYYWLILLPPSYKDCCGYIGPTQVIEDKFSILILNFIISVKSLYHVRWHIHRVWGLGFRHLWEAYHICEFSSSSSVLYPSLHSHACAHAHTHTHAYTQELP